MFSNNEDAHALAMFNKISDLSRDNNGEVTLILKNGDSVSVKLDSINQDTNIPGGGNVVTFTNEIEETETYNILEIKDAK